MHSFLYFKRAGGSHISTLFYTCNMQKRENKAIFLRISGEMAKKRRNMQPTAKRNGSMQGFAPRKHPRQACSLDCIAKLRFAFQPALPAIQSHQTFRRQPASSLPASAGNNLSSSSFFFTEQISFFHQSIIFFPARPANTLTSSSFSIQGSSSFPHPTDFIPARPAKPSQASHLSLPGPQLSISQYTTTADR